jgi:hypothetical protein
MIKQKRTRQTWWPMYALGLLMIGLLFLAHRLAPSPGWRTFLEIGVVIMGYGLIALWLETRSDELQFSPSAQADSSGDRWPELEISSPRLFHIQYHFYVASDPAIIYGGPEHSTGNLRLNGHHHLAQLSPSLLEEQPDNAQTVDYEAGKSL